MGTIKAALNSSGRVIRIASKGMVAVPIILGVCNVVNAPPELRMRTLFEQGFGVLGGFLGTVLGANAIGLGIVSMIGLGPLGLFLTVFVCATLGGIAGAQVGKGLGKKTYDFGEQLGDGKHFYSIDDFLGSLR